MGGLEVGCLVGMLVGSIGGGAAGVGACGESIPKARGDVKQKPLDFLADSWHDLAMELKDHNDLSEVESQWQAAANSAYSKVERESGKTRAAIAGSMMMTENAIQKMLSGKVRWSLNAVLRLAEASGQNPVEMLSGEAAERDGADDGESRG